MLKTRIILVAVSALLILGIFWLPKSVVENDAPLAQSSKKSTDSSPAGRMHNNVTPEVKTAIKSVRAQWASSSRKEKNAIFADSLANLYQKAEKFDSAGWFAEEASKFFNTTDSWIKAGNRYYQAYTFAVEKSKQDFLASKAQEFYRKVLDKNPKNFDVKNNLALTYLSSGSPMQGISMLREILADDPKNETALFNMGMLSVQSGQYEKAVKWLQDLIKLSPDNTQGRLLLGIALSKTGDIEGARQEFNKVKQLDKDPAVQATVDSYLKDLK
jgi:tetratricopeptide (TPR) repeat protein